MPIYEYHCEPCDRMFEALVRSAADVPKCPSCEGSRLSKQLSVPASAHVRSGSSQGDLPIRGASVPPGAFGCGAGGCGSGMCSMD